MLKGGILNTHLAQALAAMGHGDTLIVCDAGFPIPRDAWRIDLAISKGSPELLPVLEVIAAHFISEKVIYADMIPSHNPTLHQHLQRVFDTCDHETVEHARMVGQMAREAKVIVRTGAYEAWGNIALVSGTDPFAWFERADIKVTEFYQERMAQMRLAGMTSEQTNEEQP